MELKACERQAERGDVHAQVRLGQMYEMGEGVSADREKAVFWYQKAAEQGSIPAKQRLEQLVVSENPNETPIEVAFREWKGWMNRSKNTAESAPDPVLTTPEEQFSYAVRLYYGKNAAVNKEKALFFYEHGGTGTSSGAAVLCDDVQ